MSKERRRVLYRGRVQGVGFRFTTRRLASRFAVEGFVRNLDDGRVELLVEGEPAEVDGLLGAVAGEFAGKIREAAVESRPVGESPISGFVIDS